MPIALSDLAMSSLFALARALAVEDRDEFLKCVHDRIAALPPERRGDGSIALVAREEQARLLAPPDAWAHEPRWSRRPGRPTKAARFG
jgi:hypothetical protein